MKHTPHALVAFGILLLGLAYFSFARGYVYSGIDLSVGSSAQLAAERMSVEELQRVFDMPSGADTKAWLERRMGRHWTRGLGADIGFQIAVCLLGSVAFIGWGWAEFVARRTASKPGPLTATDAEATHNVPD